MLNNFIEQEYTAKIELVRKDGAVLYTIINKNDLEIANSIPGRWYAIWKTGTKSYYAYTHVLLGGKRVTIYLHRLIMNPIESCVVDHINHDTLDNTRTNLRVINRFENSQNRKAEERNKVGVRGITWSKRDRKWRVKFKIRGEYRHFGLFSDLECAKTMAESVVLTYKI